MKLLQVASVLAVFLILFGCINLNDDSLKKMDSLQQKYFVKNAFSSSPTTMTDYLNALSELRTTASFENKKLIESEVYLAESFIYQNKALMESAKLNSIYFSCSSKEAKAMITYIGIANNSLTLAKNTFEQLNDSQKEKLRPNYASLLEGIEENIVMIQEFVDDKC